jgi:hypothetical protein
VIVRAAYIKYANNSELPTLADKLDFMIKTKLVPNAGKAKAKTLEDEVSTFLSLMFFTRNNSKLASRSLMNTHSSTLFSSTSEATSRTTRCRKTSPSRLETS